MKLVPGRMPMKAVTALAFVTACAACGNTTGAGSNAVRGASDGPGGPAVTSTTPALSAISAAAGSTGGRPTPRTTAGDGTVLGDMAAGKPDGPPTPARCTAPGLQLSAVAPAGGGGMGHQGLVLIFVNTGGAACTLDGYPGVAARDTSGRYAADAARTSIGYIFPATSRSRVVLAPGGTASAGLEWTVVSSGNQTSCPTYPGLTVTPPGETRTLDVFQELSFCGGFQVHPMVKGATAGD